ncbi:MAG: hypothetical protein IT347_06390 [Candidatus Eisenbacteria bacterium]|nr:hypothetical protein [Candidatus Eisenbacteria bacterium]
MNASQQAAFQAALIELHQPRDAAALRLVAPAVFKRLIPCDYFLRLEFASAPRGNGDALEVLWDMPARATRALMRRATRLSTDHPLTAHVLRTGELGPMRLSDFWSRREQLASAMHREIYQPLGVGWMLVHPFLRGDRWGAIDLSRPFSAPDFSDRDLAMLGLLVPHFVQAVDAAERVAARRELERLTLAGLGLTPREQDVAACLVRGQSNVETAASFGMSPRTVEKHVERILGKLGVENRTSAARVIMGLQAKQPPAASPRKVDARMAFRRLLWPETGGEGDGRDSRAEDSPTRAPAGHAALRASAGRGSDGSGPSGSPRRRAAARRFAAPRGTRRPR